MRIDIKTNGQVRDKDVRSMYMIAYALDNCTEDRMKIANLRYFADKMGFELRQRQRISELMKGKG